MGAAAGVVASIVALVFGGLLGAVDDLDKASDRARSAESEIARRFEAGLVHQPSETERARLLADIRERRALAAKDRRVADDAVARAVTIGVLGMVGSAIMLFVLTVYLTQAIVVPLRRVNLAASGIAGGDLDVRVMEEGDAEPVELARSFNTMATNLQASQRVLESQNAELDAEKRRIEVAARVNRAVLDATPDPIGLLDLGGRLVAENASMAALWEREPEVDGPGQDPDREVHDEVVFDDRTYRRYAAPVRDSEGELMGRLVALHDVTSERETERLKDEFFALVSHELRTPLTSIIGYLELVHDDEDELPEDARRFLGVVDRNANRLLRLVGDLLFVAQAEAGRLALDHAELDLASVVADSAEAARPAAERGGITLAVDAPDAAPFRGDRDRLGQLIDNLLGNALKFTPRDGTVRVGLHQVGDRVVIEVRDDGPGVPEAEHDRVFERFYRSNAAVTKAVPGAGLGLAIVRTIAEGHGGGVTFASTVGKGTTVTVTLPLPQDGAA